MSHLCNRVALLFAAAVGTLVVTNARADDASCKPVLDAMTKQAGTPYHEFATANGKSFEKVYTTTKLYIGNGGHWLKTPLTPQELIERTRESGLAFSRCAALRTETVDGEATTVYAAHFQTTEPVGSNDAQIWIGSSGLPVKTEADAQVGGHKMHTSTRLSYSNVQAPTDS